jgi:cytochrome c5
MSLKLQVIPILVIAACGVLLLSACGSQTPAPVVTQMPAITPTMTQELLPTSAPALDGQKLLEERCTRCHSLDRVRQSRKSEAEWKATVERMVGKGAALSAQEIEAVVRYLAQTYPK